eukprot:443158_1
MMPTQEHRELQFVDAKAAERYKCAICLGVMRDPSFPTTCESHVFCGMCLATQMDKDDEQNKRWHKCPVCRVPFNSTEVQSCGFIQMQINQLQAYCYNYNKQQKLCTWVGDLSALPIHMGQCDFESEFCDACFSLLLRKYLPKHKETCQETVIPCPQDECDMTGRRKIINLHYKEQHANILSKKLQLLKEEIEKIEQLEKQIEEKINKL